VSNDDHEGPQHHHLLETALTWQAAGYTPVPTKTDGTKHPRVPWAKYNTTPATEQDVRRDFTADTDGIGLVTGAASGNLEMLEVDAHGFDELDRRLLRTIIEKYDGGPVGLNTLAAALAEEQDALEEVYEPFLIQIGFLDRTPRGRVATRLAYEHLGIEMPRKPTLFS